MELFAVAKMPKVGVPLVPIVTVASRRVR